MRYSKSSLAAGVILVLVLAGCSGGGADRVDVHPVSGKVTMNGAPVPNAVVSFSPKGDQPVATGRTDANGEFTMTTYEAGDGAAAGEYVVLVSKSASGGGGTAALGHDPNNPAAFDAGAAASHSAQQAAGGDALLPEKYSDAGRSPLTVTVPANDENDYNFDLQP